MALLALKSLSCSFGSHQVIDSLDLEVKEKELVSVLGSSGAGKSTLLRLIAGFDQIDDGEIWLDGKLIGSSSGQLEPERRSIGIVPQDYALFPHLSVSQNIAFGLGKLPAAERSARVAELIKLARLEGLEEES